MPPLTNRTDNPVSELLKRLSYKPGWKVKLVEVPTEVAFDCVVIYDAYESENAAFDPLVIESEQVYLARMKLSQSCGNHIRLGKQWMYRKRFYKPMIEDMTPEYIIKFVIANTIKEAEMYEFDRWFKFEGVPIFENKNSSPEFDKPVLGRWR